MLSDKIFSSLTDFFELGGPVVVLLIVVSVITLTIILFKIFQFTVSAVGNNQALYSELRKLVTASEDQVARTLTGSRNIFAPMILDATNCDKTEEAFKRLQAAAEIRFVKLESGFRFLDTVVQLAPLLGLFGTVLGMIEAFQALQAAGTQVDPSLLAGGIWVALLTTAVGLIIAIPTATSLAWLESRVEKERVFFDWAIALVFESKIENS
jgi:biopolymer transport protein ExbB